MENKIMTICIKNTENKEGRNWKFESDFGCIIMFELLSKHIGETPKHCFLKSLKIIMISVTNRQLDNILNNLDVRDPFYSLYLQDIHLLRHGKTAMC